MALLSAALPKGVAHLIRGNFFIEILHPDVNKGEGLKGLCESLQVFEAQFKSVMACVCFSCLEFESVQCQISLDDVVAFGDGDNDAEFLRFSGLGIAMLNGSEMAKENANRVSEKDHHEHGVAVELSKIFGHVLAGVSNAQ